MKTKTRLFALTLTVMIVCMQLMSFVVYAATNIGSDMTSGGATVDQLSIDDISYTDGSDVTNLKSGQRVNVTISYLHKGAGFVEADQGESRSVEPTKKILGSSFNVTSNSTMKVSVSEFYANSNTALITIDLKHVTYNSPKKLYIRDLDISLGSVNSYKINFNTDIPEIYFSGGTGGTSTSDPDDDETYTSDIIIENAFAKTKNAESIKEVSKETEPFTMEVIFSDRGLRDVDIDEFTSDTLSVYITDAGDFILTEGARGTLTRTATPTGDPPRFRATFTGLKYTGTTANAATLTFRVQYDIYGQDVKGEGKAMLYTIVRDEDEEDEEDEIPPPTPYIIINQYDLGADQIEAGSKFTMSFSFGNTSKDVPLENIRLTVNPVTIGTTESSFLSIASATNTYYYEALAAGGSLGQQIEILVKGNATVGSQAISVSFTYEYLVDKERKSGETETTIYIPITQIDRFQVDPLTDYSSWMTLGEEGYATISFVNHGKSTTYNVSGYILDAQGNQGQTEHYGNLEAGAYGTLDFTLSPADIGDYTGTIMIRYENENGEENEIETQFTAFVEEPYMPSRPGNEDPGMIEPIEPESNNNIQWILFSVGGLAIAIPLALYIAKRIKLKGSEDFDEDF